MRHYFLSLSARSLRVLVRRRHVFRGWFRGVLEDAGEFPHSPEGLAAFSACLDRNRDSAFHLLVDLSDEHFQSETIPFLRGRERRTVLERKCARMFDAAALALAIPVGYEKGRRMDERLLFAALLPSAALTPWLNLLRSAGACLAGIYSPPLLAPDLLSAFAITTGAEHCLLLSLQDESLRQTYCENGRLRFSRLTPLTESSEKNPEMPSTTPPFRLSPVLAQRLADETLTLRHYLTSQRLLPREKTLEIFILAHPGDFTALTGVMRDGDGIRHHFLDITECAAHYRIPAPHSSRADDFHLRLLAHKPPRARFSDTTLSQFRRLRRERRLLNACVAVWVACCLAFAAVQYYTASAIDRKTEAIAREAAQAAQRYEEISAAFMPLPIAAESLFPLTARYRELARAPLTPEDFLDDLVQVLNDETAVEIDAIEWENSTPADGGMESAQQATISGHIRPSEVLSETATRTRTQTVSQSLTHFTNRLRALPGMRVQILATPAAEHYFRLRLTRTVEGTS